MWQSDSWGAVYSPDFPGPHHALLHPVSEHLMTTSVLFTPWTSALPFPYLGSAGIQNHLHLVDMYISIRLWLAWCIIVEDSQVNEWSNLSM